MRLSFTIMFTLSTMIVINTSHAFDEQNILKKFQTYAQENNIIFTFGSVEKGVDNSLTIKNADYYDEKSDRRQQVDSITFANVRETITGNLQYDSIEVFNFKQKSKIGSGETNILIERILSEGLQFSDNPETHSKAFWPSRIALGKITNLTIETNDNDVEAKILFPFATLHEIEQTGLHNFKSESVKLSAGTGTVKSDKDEATISVGASTLENMERFGTQGLGISLIDVGAIGIDFTSRTDEKVDFVFEGMNIKNFFSPDLSAGGNSLLSDKDLSAEIKPLSVTIDGKEFAGWKHGYGTAKQDASKNAVISNGRFEGIFFDFNSIPQNAANAEMFKTLEELNLMKMVLNIEGTGSWERETGLLDISRYNIQLEDGAAFQVSARVSGYTEEVARQFTKALSAMNAEPDAKKKNALAFQTMAYLAGLSIQRMEIVLDDQSLLDRVVNLQAKKLKQEPDQIKGIVGPMTTIMLTPYNIPELAAQTSQALGIFMQGNKKLTITAEPVNGLAITEIIALSSGVQAGSVTPADFAKRLNLNIAAE